MATQHNVLRTKYFIGLPDMVINYFKFVARECREIMAAMGVRSLAELIGHTELLEILPGETSKQRKLDLAPVLAAREAVKRAYAKAKEINPNPGGIRTAEERAILFGQTAQSVESLAR